MSPQTATVPTTRLPQGTGVRAGAAAARSRGRRVLYFVAVLATVAVVDQLVKAWAWRHVADVHINDGGDILVGATLNAWFARPVRGALLDVVDSVVLATAAVVLLRRRRPPLVLAGGSLLVAGWTSNLADRLGAHFWTAPGSVRGVVDFVPFDGHYWNLADLVIIVGAVLFAAGLALEAGKALLGRAERVGRAKRREVTPAGRLLGRSAAATGFLTVCVLAVLGAVSFAGVTTPYELLATR